MDRLAVPPRGAMSIRVGVWALLVASVLGVLPGATQAQVFQGQVIDDERGSPLATALVRLLDTEQTPLAIAVADSAGGYRLEAPEPGSYFVSVERLGYQTLVSHLFEVLDPDGVYPVDLGMQPDPVAISGLTVRADRFAAVQRRVRSLIGMSPSSLRVPPLLRPTLEDHLEEGRNLEDIVRWSNLPSITVRTTTDGPCFQDRMRGCLDVFLDDVRMNPELVNILPLELVEAMVVLMPLESIRYEAGGILLYTVGWIG